ncbi:cytochrome C oxidase subunit IV family protein [Aurantimonas sp. C2-6-R+9]|uniref:Cytochrome C oxidase subunit IV n=2 Tax=root TaxID=1 RepID=A0A9C9NKJ1_9HYPH|nr:MULTISPECIES: cytochrome C oxidase subunit IV family protein [unclassified Aurantimonas]MEC5290198.1 cytochrome C oxidase subunit IV family protein [Aurantimonas sp. C2-3-R2]MEC5321740.1 cytochrome C oxidase subunit IV family protein [Aurantimonas sp. A3-2-R12]MEC5380309.1 cytochrome C oxidase subunit IV family protein [Aurantimonas sp. C2-6-R+9]MEC5411262.1 cytochrome C oxidase subunit IV family protein [Aurantimonas sp. C2-4-R8]HDZ71840.1 cytochrome C oxidase subunit IV [Aurantimonas cora
MTDITVDNRGHPEVAGDAHDPIPAEAPAAEGHQQHPIRLYLVVWGSLFVLSAFSYLVDYAGLQGYLRWSLILLFMMLKAGLIVAVFMHIAWERLALTYAILLPPLAVLVFTAMMVFESEYTLLTRITFFGVGP